MNFILWNYLFINSSNDFVRRVETFWFHIRRTGWNTLKEDTSVLTSEKQNKHNESKKYEEV